MITLVYIVDFAGLTGGRVACMPLAIKGIGIDLVNLPRVQRVLQRFPLRFPSRILTAREATWFDELQDEARRVQFIANRWATKEALFKAVSGTVPVTWKDVELYSTPSGQPKCRLFEYYHMHVSISHDHDQTVALVIREVALASNRSVQAGYKGKLHRMSPVRQFDASLEDFSRRLKE